MKRSFWKGWKNFEEVAKAVRAINNPGISSHVEHAENESYARIKILPNVDDAFIVTEPQLIHNPGACIYLVKRAEKWKVYQLQIMREPKARLPYKEERDKTRCLSNTN